MEVLPDVLDPFFPTDDDDTPSTYSSAHPETVSAFAKLEFPDTEYYLKAHKATLGRGNGLPKVLLVSHSPESPPADFFDSTTQTSRKRKRNTDDVDFMVADDDYGDSPAKSPFPGGLGGGQEMESTPDPDGIDGERINVWPPADSNGELIQPNAISRRHLQIVWDTETRSWAMQIFGRNGLFINGEFYPSNSTTSLQDGDCIMLKALEFRFFDLTCNRYDGRSDSDEEDDEVSNSGLLYSGSENENSMEDSSDDELEDEMDQDEEDDDDDDDEEGDEEHLEEARAQQQKPKSIRLTITSKSNQPQKAGKRRKRDTIDSVESAKSKTGSRGKTSEGRARKSSVSQTKGSGKRTGRGQEQSEDEADGAQPSVEGPPKKRGPGRPPADGVMSKKKRKDEERARRLGLSSVDELPTKPNTKPRKDKEQRTDSADGVKKSKKGKRTSDDQGSGDETDQDANGGSKATPEPPEPPLRKEDFTEEQLAKPDLTYAQALYEILKDQPDPMGLPQIYNAFKKKWPYYAFLDGHGWESSIRHNLQSTPCVVRAGKEGKGHKWKVDPNIPFETKSAKKSTQRAQNYPQHPQHSNQASQPLSAQQGQYPYAGSPQGYYPQYPQRPGGPQTQGMPPYQQGFANGQQPAANGGFQYQSNQAQANFQRPGGPNQNTMSPQGATPGVPYQSQPPRPGQPGTAHGPAQQQYPSNPGSAPNGQSRPGMVSYPPAAGNRPGSQNAPMHNPTPPPNRMPGPAEVAANKRKIYETFKSSLLRSAPDAPTKARYTTLVDDAIKWLMDHPNSIEYDGPQGDLKTVITQMQNAWTKHPSNPMAMVNSPRNSPAVNTHPSQHRTNVPMAASSKPSTPHPQITGQNSPGQPQQAGRPPVQSQGVKVENGHPPQRPPSQTQHPQTQQPQQPTPQVSQTTTTHPVQQGTVQQTKVEQPTATQTASTQPASKDINSNSANTKEEAKK